MSDLEKARQDELTAWVVLQDKSALAVEACRNGLDLAPWLEDIQAARDEWNRVLLIRLRAEEMEREEERALSMREETERRPVTIEEIDTEATPRERRSLIDLGYAAASDTYSTAERAEAKAALEELRKQISARVVQVRLATHDAWARIRKFGL